MTGHVKSFTPTTREMTSARVWRNHNNATRSVSDIQIYPLTGNSETWVIIDSSIRMGECRNPLCEMKLFSLRVWRWRRCKRRGRRWDTVQEEGGRWLLSQQPARRRLFLYWMDDENSSRPASYLYVSQCTTRRSIVL